MCALLHGFGNRIFMKWQHLSSYSHRLTHILLYIRMTILYYTILCYAIIVMTKHKRMPVTLCTEMWAGTCDSLLRLNVRREEPRDREPSMELISEDVGEKLKINRSNRNREAGNGEQLTCMTEFIFVPLQDNLSCTAWKFICSSKRKVTW